MATRVKIIQGEVLKVGDGKPDLIAQLVEPDGVPKDLSTGINSISFYMREEGTDTLVVDGTATIDGADNGRVKFDWADDGSDLSSAGTYEAEFEVEETGPVTTTYPGDGYVRLKVREALK